MPGRKHPFDPNATEKICTKCDAMKPLDAFLPDRRARDGRTSACRVCRALSSRRWRDADPERYRDARRRTYVKHRDALLSHNRMWRIAHRDRLLAYDRRRAEARKASHQDRMQNTEYRQYRQQSSRRWRVLNPEKCRVYNRRYASAHPGFTANNNARRRARIMRAPVIERIDRLEVAERDNWTCHICGQVIKRSELSMDHLVPLSLGGEHSMRNIAAAHRRCNSRRGAGRIPAQLRLM